MLQPSLKPNTLLGVHSQEPDWKTVDNRQNTVFIKFPVNVAEATFVKKADR
jgi:hypothetical protein